MEATSATTFSIGSTTSFAPKLSLNPQSKAWGARFNPKNSVKSFISLKAVTSSVGFQLGSSFFAKESIASFRGSHIPNAQKENQTSRKNCQPLGFLESSNSWSSWGDRSTTSAFDQKSPLVSNLSQCNTPSQTLDFTGASELGSCLKGVNVVVIPAGVRRKPGMTRGDLFNINAKVRVTSQNNSAKRVADVSAPSELQHKY